MTEFRASRQMLVMIAILVAAALRPNTSSVWASVDLNQFYAQGSADRIILIWETGNELDNLGFHLWRAVTQDRENAVQISENLIPSAVAGQPVGASYRFEDLQVSPDSTYYYWLEDIDTSGASKFHGPTPGSLSGAGSTLATPTADAVGGGQASSLPTSTPPPSSTPQSEPTQRFIITPTPTNTPAVATTIPISPTPAPDEEATAAQQAATLVTATGTQPAGINEADETGDTSLERPANESENETSVQSLPTHTTAFSVTDAQPQQPVEEDVMVAITTSPEDVEVGSVVRQTETPRSIGDATIGEVNRDLADVGQVDSEATTERGRLWIGLLLGAVVLFIGAAGILIVNRSAKQQDSKL